MAGIGGVGAPGEDLSDSAETAARGRASGMRAAVEEIAAEEPEPAPGWLLDNLASTEAEMFALLLEAWASEPAGWADFPRVRAILDHESSITIAGRDPQFVGDTVDNQPRHADLDGVGE